MKLFGYQFGKQKIQEPIVLNQSQQPADSLLANFESFSLLGTNGIPSFDTNPNLSYPVVKEIYQQGGMVLFGVDNLQPNELVRLYYTSPLHRSICEFKKAIATNGGYSYEIPPVTQDEKINLYKFENSIKLSKSYKDITDGLIIHSRVCIELLFDDNGKYLRGNVIDPVKIRNGARNDRGEIDTYYFSQDFTLSGQKIAIPAYKPGKTAKRMLYVYQHKSPGMDIYCLPTWSSAANEIYLSGELTYMRKSYMINSINPAFYLNFPRRLNEQGQLELKKALSAGKGTKNNGKTLVFQSDSAEAMPTVGTIAPSNNDKLFSTTYNQTNEIICMSHSINPGVMGFKVNSSLGSGNELQTSYSIFKNTIIKSLKSDVEEIVNDIMFIANINSKFVLNDYEIIDWDLINKK